MEVKNYTLSDLFCKGRRPLMADFWRFPLPVPRLLFSRAKTILFAMNQ